MDDWPPELDALIAAPEHHRLLHENEQVRVLETIIRPGETTRLHTHQWPAATTVLAWSRILRRDETGAVTYDSERLARNPGEVMWSGPLGPHTLQNIGDSVLHVVTVEIKNQAQKSPV